MYVEFEFVVTMGGMTVGGEKETPSSSTPSVSLGVENNSAEEQMERLGFVSIM
jgi:hypothetical protein